MVDAEVFDRRLEKLEVVLNDLRELAKVSEQRFLEDRGLQAQAERWTQVAAETCIDLANHVIADRGLPTPNTYREAFEILAKHGVIEPELASRMGAWAGLRNLLVHVYLEVDHQRLYEILTTDLHELESFAAAMASAA